MLCICARVVSTICSGHRSARAAAAIFSMTCSLFFSLFFAVSMRQVDIASKAAFTALRASSESLGAHIGLKLQGVTSSNLLMAAQKRADEEVYSYEHAKTKWARTISKRQNARCNSRAAQSAGALPIIKRYY